MKELLATNGGIIGLATLIMLSALAMLSGVSKGLEVIKDKTATKVDDKIYAFANKAASFLQTCVDWIAPRSKTPESK